MKPFIIENVVFEPGGSEARLVQLCRSLEQIPLRSRSQHANDIRLEMARLLTPELEET